MAAPPDLAHRAASRRWLPRSFYWRALLILIVPIIVLQLAVALMFLQRHYEDVTVQMTSNMSREIALVRARPELGESLGIAAVDGPEVTQIRPWDLSGRAMRERMAEMFPDLVAIDTVSDRRSVALRFADGTGLEFARSSVSASNPHQLLVLMFGVAIMMTAISLLFMRGQIRPIRRLARAAEGFGRGQDIAYWPTGSTEVRAAGTAFLAMRARIERHIEQRTLLLSGVSHDLRTPLTRMKLELSMMEGDEADALSRDVAAMERIIDTFLDFAREDAGDIRQATEVLALVREATEAASPSGGVVVAGDPVEADLFPDGMRRAVANLVGNAMSYGTRARVEVAATDGTIVVTVEDDGPGIPEDRRADAVRPFARLDTARTNTRGNVGLGLSIVRDVARAHGGSLRLGTSEMGGLKAEIILPR
ncbi:ATP-binding protein [uncultured Jannaschia sp.]|uniref:ATP-binding protein n=1 Tax=uncultured Jannaschia sp. TaxID=293347 RepID=UPI0026071A83|nr:ATP-binding protein [uncultured Jannaschia sp.]